VLACSLGGILGSWARYGVQLAVPHSAGQFPWATVVINATGSFLIGALMIVLLVLTSPHRLVRPFLGVGVLGGYTTYSTFAVDAEDLVLDHRAGVALGYVVVTVVVCAAAVWLSTVLTLRAGRALATARPHLRSHR
jgi:CrcB protein